MPATSANLGPGFDSAGLALGVHDVLEFEVVPAGLEVTIRGVGAGELPTDESHLVLRAFRAACDELGWSPPGLRLRAENAIPQGRGLGSSAAAVVAGILGAWSLCPTVAAPDPAAMLRLATEMEGHPDNVAACLLGGVTLSWVTSIGPRAVGLDVDPRLRPLLLVPDAQLHTHVARGLLPAQVPHADAAFNAGRAALLVHALARDPGLLLDATEDRLHQRQRAEAMPESDALLRALRAAGHAAVVSGAGPSLLVLTAERPGDDEGVRKAVDAADGAWRTLAPDLDRSGACVLTGGPAVSS